MLVCAAIAHLGEEIIGAHLAAFECELEAVKRGAGCVAAAERDAGREGSDEGERIELELLDGMSCGVATGDEDSAHTGCEDESAQQAAKRLAERFAMLCAFGLRAERSVEDDAAAVLERLAGLNGLRTPGRSAGQAPSSEAQLLGTANLSRGGGRAASTEHEQAVNRFRGSWRDCCANEADRFPEL